MLSGCVFQRPVEEVGDPDGLGKIASGGGIDGRQKPLAIPQDPTWTSAVTAADHGVVGHVTEADSGAAKGTNDVDLVVEHDMIAIGALPQNRD